MTRYLISFDDGAMDFPEEDLPTVARAAHDVLARAKAAGVWVTGGGLHSQRATIASPDGTVSEGPFPEAKAVIGGFSIIDVATREEAVYWAIETARACRCPQEIRELMDDPEVLVAGQPVAHMRWRRWGSNPRPQACKARALPTELRPRRDYEPTLGLSGYSGRWRRIARAR